MKNTETSVCAVISCSYNLKFSFQQYRDCNNKNKNRGRLSYNTSTTKYPLVQMEMNTNSQPIGYTED